MQHEAIVHARRQRRETGRRETAHTGSLTRRSGDRVSVEMHEWHEVSIRGSRQDSGHGVGTRHQCHLLGRTMNTNGDSVPRKLSSWVEEQFAGTREDRPFSFDTLVTDHMAVKTEDERAQLVIANAFDRAYGLATQAIDNGGLHQSYRAELDNQFAVIRAALVAQMGR